MAQLAHTQTQVIPANTRTRRVIGGAILALLVAGAVVLALTLPGNDSSSVTSENQSSAVAPSARFDGGPNEGTRGALSQPVESPTIRFDGGPQEGTRGAIVQSLPVQSPAVSSTRFDGGPEEGTRGAAVEYNGSTRFDGGPDEGTRGR
jgi:hypothetical protein